MVNPLLVSAARTAPVVIASVAAVPAAAGLAAVATLCLCSIMIVRHRTQTDLSLRVRKGQGFVFDVVRQADTGTSKQTDRIAHD
jgi:hypothetical protein